MNLKLHSFLRWQNKQDLEPLRFLFLFIRISKPSTWFGHKFLCEKRSQTMSSQACVNSKELLSTLNDVMPADIVPPTGKLDKRENHFDFSFCSWDPCIVPPLANYTRERTIPIFHSVHEIVLSSIGFVIRFRSIVHIHWMAMPRTFFWCHNRKLQLHLAYHTIW